MNLKCRIYEVLEGFELRVVGVLCEGCSVSCWRNLGVLIDLSKPVSKLGSLNEFARSRWDTAALVL